MPDYFHHRSSEKLLRSIKDRIDDVDAIWIVFDNAITARSQNGFARIITNVAGIVLFCDKSTLLLHPHDLESLLNDPVVRKLRNPFRLLLSGQSMPDDLLGLKTPQEEE
jgi:hypothetical protein